MSTTDHTRETLAEVIGRRTTQIGGDLNRTLDLGGVIADAILASPWLAAHVAAVVEGKDAEIAEAERESGKSLDLMEEALDQRDAARAAVAAEQERAWDEGQWFGYSDGYADNGNGQGDTAPEGNPYRIAQSTTDGGGTDDTRRGSALFNDITRAPRKDDSYWWFSDRQLLADYLWTQGWRRDVRPEDVTETVTYDGYGAPIVHDSEDPT